MTIFSKRAEALSGILTIAFFVAIAAEIFKVWSTSSKEYQYADIFFNMFLGSAYHIGLTFITLLAIPEIKDMYKQRKVYNSIWFQALLMFFLFFITKWFFNAPKGSFLSILVNFSLVFWPIYHALRQRNGINILYNKAIGLSEKQANFDRYIFHVLTAMAALESLFGVLVRERVLVGDQIASSRLLVLVLSCLPCLFLFRSASAFRYKNLFLLRLFFIPLGLYSSAAYLASATFHAFEYMMVSEKILKNSKCSARQYFNGFSVSLILVIVFFRLFQGRFGLAGNIFAELDYTSVWQKNFQFINGGLIYAHMYLDSLMFKMKDPKTREVVAPLLAS